MALIGSTVDPRMFVQDYSGFQNAAAIRAAGMMNLGNQIGGAIKDYGNQQKEAKAGIAKGKAALEFAKTLHPELADQITQLGQVFNDPSKSQVELSAIGNQMGDHVAALLGEQRFQQELGIKQQEVDVQKAALIARHSQPQDSPLTTPFLVPDGKGGEVMRQLNKATGRIVPAQFEDPTLLDLPPLDANGNPMDQSPDMWGADGGVLPVKGEIVNSIAGAARLGYKPPEGGTGQVMSGEELADLLRKGLEFKSEPDGSGQFRVTEVRGGRNALVNVSPGSTFGPDDLKKGYRETRDENGNITISAIPDSPAFFEMEQAKLDLAKKQAEASGKSKDDYIKSAQDEQNNLVGGVQLRAVEDALNLINEIPQGSGVTGGAKRAISAAIPGSTVKQLEAAIAPIKNTEFIKNLGAMRAASPTGGAVGQVSDAEGQRFEQLRASLDIVNQNPDQLRRNLLLFKEASLDYIHGSRAQREKLVKEGKVTPEINAQIEALYPQSTVGADGKMQPRNASGPRVDPSLLDKFPAFAPR